MNNKGFTLIELLATILILAIFLLIAIPIMIASGVEDKSCGYHYTDINGKEGVATYCSTSYNVLKCRDGYSKQIQVAEYEYICE